MQKDLADFENIGSVRDFESYLGVLLDEQHAGPVLVDLGELFEDQVDVILLVPYET